MKRYLFRGSSLLCFVTLFRRLWKPVWMSGAIVLAAAAVPAGANEEIRETEEKSSILAVIRAPAPKQLTEKIMAAARKIQPGIMTEALPAMLGEMLGDPTMESISGTENIGLVLLASGGEMAPVLLLKLTEESPLRGSLPGFEYSLHDFEGWTFALPEGVSSELVQGRQEALIAAVRSPRRYDIELMADGPGIAQKLREAYEGFPDLGGMGAMFIGPMMEGLATEADALRDFRIGLNVSGEKIEQVYYMKAVEGTPMAALFDQKRAQDLDFARLISPDGAIAYLGGFDVAATRQYFDHFFGLLSRGIEGPGKEIWEKMREVAGRYFESTDGRVAGVMTFQGMELQLASITPSTLSNDELLAMLGQTVGAMDELLDKESPRPEYELLPDQLEVNGVPVHIMRTEIKLDERIEFEGDEPAFAMPNQKQDMFYAIAGGYMLNTSDAERMKKLIEAVQEGEPVENNLASLIKVADENLFELQVDVLRYVSDVMAPMMAPEMGVTLQQLRDQGLKPVKGMVKARGGEAEFSLAVPVDTIAAAYHAIAGLMVRQRGQEDASPAPTEF